MIERYSRPEMAALWTLEARFSAWLEVELAVCEAWAKLGVVPQADLAEIRAKAGFDVDRILEIEEKTRHDVIAFLTAVEEKVGPSARFIHLGCTSSDIVDTANALLLTRAGAIILADIDRVLGVLRDMAIRHKDQLCMGRTHGIHAEPTSFGLKMAGFYAEFTRHRERFAAALENIRVGKISGAVGTYAHLSPELEAGACDILGLAVDPVSTQIIQRDRHAHYFTALALLGGGVERLCTELRHLQRTEVLEVEEGFAKGQKGSSAMPHKKNPISAENLCGLSRLLRTNAIASMENMPLWHERDISHSSVERVIMPDSTILADYILGRLAGLLKNLRVIPENMARNLEGSYGLFYSQRVLVELIEMGLPRQRAYEMVQAAAMRSWDGRKSFRSEVEGDAEIRRHLSLETLERLFDPCYYLRYVTAIYERVFGQGWGKSE
jgi:adenylosuccinate lyase